MSDRLPWVLRCPISEVMVADVRIYLGKVEPVHVRRLIEHLELAAQALESEPVGASPEGAEPESPEWRAGLEAAVKVIEGGSFLHAEAPDARWAREVVAAIRRKYPGAPEAPPPSTEEARPVKHDEWCNDEWCEKELFPSSRCRVPAPPVEEPALIRDHKFKEGPLSRRVGAAVCWCGASRARHVQASTEPPREEEP